MDTNVFQQAQGWIEQEFANKQMVSKDQLWSDAQSANLPQEAKASIQQLPQGNLSKDQVIGQVRDKLMSGAGGMGGMMGGQGGGMPGGMGG
jgi:hypothetical protein